MTGRRSRPLAGAELRALARQRAALRTGALPDAQRHGGDGARDRGQGADVARRARQAADWLGEGILRRSAPLPGLIWLQAVG